MAAMCLSLGAFADTSTTATVPVTLTVDNEYRAVNVTVPASLPIHVINGTVVTADNAKITNNSTNGTVRVTEIQTGADIRMIDSFQQFRQLIDVAEMMKRIQIFQCNL